VVGCQEGSPFFTNVGPGIEGDDWVSRPGSRSVMEVFHANSVPVAKKPCQGGSGRRKVEGADENAPDVGCTIADDVGVAVADDHGRRDRRIAASPGGQHPVRRDGGAKGLDAEGRH
jgi:hypothetical protein